MCNNIPTIFISWIYDQISAVEISTIVSITRIQYALCRRNAINQGIIINSEWKGSPGGNGKSMYACVSHTKRPCSKHGWTGNWGSIHQRLCFTYMYSLVKDNIFILVPTTISRTRSAVARVHAALFIFLLGTRDKRQSTFPVANSNTLFEKIMWRKYCCSLFDARKSVNIFAYYFANCKLAFAMYIYDDWANCKKKHNLISDDFPNVSCGDLCVIPLFFFSWN